jgi:phosphoribosylanthranilate isomerase
VGTDIKFCGLTRAEDAQYAASVDASYVGVIFAGGPREITVSRATEVLRDVPAHVKRVGVFADQTADQIAEIAKELGLDVIQLHLHGDVDHIEAIRQRFAGAIWAVARVSGAKLPSSIAPIVDAADGLLLDAHVVGSLGGTGVTLPWIELAHELDRIRGARTLILAGGLRPENVGQAVATIHPDVVDVSSGVEVSPGIKDHARMRAFRDAVLHASIPT